MGYLNVIALTYTEINWSFVVEKENEKKAICNILLKLIIIEGSIKCSKSF